MGIMAGTSAARIRRWVRGNPGEVRAVIFTAGFWVVTILLVIFGIGSIKPLHQLVTLPWPVMFGLYLFASLPIYKVTLGGGTSHENALEFAIVAGMLFASPLAATLTASAASLGILTNRGVRPVRDAYNVINGIWRCTIGVLVYYSLHPDPMHPLAGGTIAAVVAGGLAAEVAALIAFNCIIALHEWHFNLGSVARHSAGSIVSVVTNLSFALVILAVITADVVLTLALLAPLAAVILAQRAVASERQRAGALNSCFAPVNCSTPKMPPLKPRRWRSLLLNCAM